MAKYIDAEKLKAEVKIIQQSLENRDVRSNQVKKIRTECMIEFCKCIIDVITSLQQEQQEMDLEKFDKDVTKIWGRCAAEPNDSIACFHIETFNEVARHFYELGFKASKED